MMNTDLNLNREVVEVNRSVMKTIMKKQLQEEIMKVNVPEVITMKLELNKSPKQVIMKKVELNKRVVRH